MATTLSSSFWLTPSGTLTLDEMGGLSLLVRTSLRSDEAVKASVEALAELSQPPFLGPGGLQRSELGYTLTWPARGSRVPLATLARQWRAEPALYIADAINAALSLSRSIGALQHLTQSPFLLSPAQIFRETDDKGRERWAILPLPLDTASFKDMAAASPDLIAFLSGEDLIRRGTSIDRPYMLAALLYHGLIGDLNASERSPMRRLQRQITYRVTSAPAARAVLDAAIPTGLAIGARRLCDFILEALGPGFGRPMTVAQAVTRLERLAVELAPPILAGGWETAGRAEHALKILESHARSAPPEEVPWRTLARLRGEESSPDDPGEPAPFPGRSDTIADFSPIARIRAIAALGIDDGQRLSSALTAMIQPGAPELAEDERLFVAYSAARWLRAVPMAHALLSSPCRVSWNEATRLLLVARLQSDQRTWAQVARSCRDCIAMVEHMPGTGGERGAYAMAYAMMLDAGAHIEFVKAGHPAAYLEDAWRKLELALSLAKAVRSLSLDEGIAMTLSALRDQLLLARSLQHLQAAVDGIRVSFKIAANDVIPDMAVPWPDDSLLFSA